MNANEQVSQRDAAAYIESMLMELRTMSQQIDADFLVYMIEMAMTEASDIANGNMTPAREATAQVTRPKELSLEQMADLYFQGAYD